MIYCVEDDNSIRELVVYTLKNSGYNAKGVISGEELFAAIATEKPKLILLDIMLPGDDGITILKKLKAGASTSDIPVILLTAKSTEYDKVIGLDSGADDYITKPFGMMELISRVKAVLRRTNQMEVKGGKYSLGPVELNSKSHTVTVKGELVELTLKEFQLLELLLENQGIVLTRDVLLERIWGYDFMGETRTVDVHIKTLRSKLGTDIIETIRGVGYKAGR